MRCLSFWVYRLEGVARRQRYFITCHPAFDAHYWAGVGQAQVVVLTPPLSIARALELQDMLQRQAETPRQEAVVIVRQLRRWQLPLPPPIELVEPLAEWDGQLEAEHLHQLLAGRILLLDEVERAVQERRLWLSHSLTDLLQYLFLEGLIDCRAAVGTVPSCRCLRCGSTDLKQENCLECGEREVLVCNTCGDMGLAKSCSPYYATPASERQCPLDVQPVLPFQLTTAQEQAADALQRFVGSGRASVCLFWAVCGAGKTETTLLALAQVLRLGGHVLWATPRRDVVQELAPRLQAAFPDLEVAAYHGGTSDRFADVPLVIATTHQALRLYSAFDLVILDEVDAFPYLHNPMLELAVRRALRPEGKLIYLTATPTEDLLQQARRGQVEQVLLPVRFHGQPLPEPELHRLRLPVPSQAAWPVPRLLANMLLDSVERDLCQTMVFVPSVALAEVVGKALSAHFAASGNADWVEHIHAADPERVQKRSRFFAGEFPILVTTTLMERGITIPRLNIIVLYADREPVFNESTLIQIAGRAGRSAEYPEGRVCFLAERRSRAMLGAKQKILGLNLSARQITAADREVDNNG